MREANEQSYQVFAVTHADDARQLRSISGPTPIDLVSIGTGELVALCARVSELPDLADWPANPNQTPTRATIVRFESVVQWIHDRIDCLPSRLQPPVSAVQVTRWLDENGSRLQSRFDALRGHTEMTAWWHVQLPLVEPDRAVLPAVSQPASPGTHYLKQRSRDHHAAAGRSGEACELEQRLRRDLGACSRQLVVVEKRVSVPAHSAWQLGYRATTACLPRGSTGTPFTSGDRILALSSRLPFEPDPQPEAEHDLVSLTMLCANALVLRRNAAKVKAQLECTLVQNKRSVIVRGPLPLYFFLDSSGLP
jgi:hypothetical protein